MGGFIKPQAANAIDQAAKRAAFIAWFGLTVREADTLAALFNAKGSSLTSTQIANAVAGAKDRVQVSICILRKAMFTEAIDRDEQGYRLTEIGMGEANQALTMMARSLVG